MKKSYKDWMLQPVTLPDGEITNVMWVLSGRYEPSEHQPIECLCGWKGEIWETKEGDYHRRGFGITARDGHEYACPKCKEIVWRWAWLIS